MTEQLKPKVAWALEVLNDAPGDYQELTLWLILNWAYTRHKWCAQQVKQIDPEEEKAAEA